MSEEYRIEIKVKNNNILKMIEKRGYSTVGEFCRLNPAVTNDVALIGELVNLKKSPLSANGDYRPMVYRLCDSLECTPEDLFTDTQLRTALETNKRTLQVNEAEMQFALENMNATRSLEQIIDDRDLNTKLFEALDKLTPREKKGIEMNFGLNGMHEHTLQEVADYFGVTRERTRQIILKAMRKLRHPSRTEDLRIYMES